MTVGGRVAHGVLLTAAAVALFSVGGCGSPGQPYWSSPDARHVVRVEQTDSYWVVMLEGRRQASDVVGCLARGGSAGDFGTVVWEGPSDFRVSTSTGGLADVQLEGAGGTDGYAVSFAAPHGPSDDEGDPLACPDDLDS